MIDGRPVPNVSAGPRAMAADALDAAAAVVGDLRVFDDDGPDGIPGSGDDDGVLDLVVILHPEPGWEVEPERRRARDRLTAIEARPSTDRRNGPRPPTPSWSRRRGDRWAFGCTSSGTSSVWRTCTTTPGIARATPVEPRCGSGAWADGR